MSDFGSVVIFRKNEGDFSPEDISVIEQELKNVVIEEKYPSNITAGGFQTLKEWGEGVYCSMITEYYDDDDLRKFAEEDDLPECERIIEDLQAILGGEFSMEASFEDW